MRELSLHIMDIAQNSITAGAGLIRLSVLEQQADNSLVIRVEDNGCGMDKAQLERVQSPFFSTRKTRSIGMGVPLFKMACEMTGGRFSIDSVPGAGTTLEARFDTGHIDMIPIGDMGETVLLLVTCNPALDFVYTRRLNNREFVLDTRWLRGELGEEIPLNAPEVVGWLRDFLAEGHASLQEQST